MLLIHLKGPKAHHGTEAYIRPWSVKQLLAKVKLLDILIDELFQFNKNADD